MACACDLYLLVIGSRYDSHPIDIPDIPDDDSRSVTHLEFDLAREANPRKARVFLPRDIASLTDPERHGEFRAFVAKIMDFRNGYDCFTCNRDDLRTLEAETRHAIAQRRDTSSKERNPAVETLESLTTRFGWQLAATG